MSRVSTLPAVKFVEDVPAIVTSKAALVSLIASPVKPAAVPPVIATEEAAWEDIVPKVGLLAIDAPPEPAVQSMYCAVSPAAVPSILVIPVRAWEALARLRAIAVVPMYTVEFPRTEEDTVPVKDESAPFVARR